MKITFKEHVNINQVKKKSYIFCSKNQFAKRGKFTKYICISFFFYFLKNPNCEFIKEYML
jgi:hypothetical protein